jgi:hypothetical protein
MASKEFSMHFTLAEAQAKLHQIMPRLLELQELKQDLDRRGYDVYKHQYFGGMGPNGQKVFPWQMEHLVEIINELTQQGIVIKDLNSVLIDFPHLRKNDEEVLLCFRLGESEITAWHTLEGGFAGRQPLGAL